MRQGVSPKYMLPAFPSLTFPNHFTLVNGLHPETHGIVGNTFYDPALQAEFDYGDSSRSMQSQWWTAEPIWRGRGGIQGVKASYVDQYNGDKHLDNKANRILGWLDLPSTLDESAGDATELRPQLIAAYVPNVDSDGHLYGPNSTYIRSTIAKVDGMLGALFDGGVKFFSVF
ncbi:hypothetical protein LTR53_014263 [Teratosphaeriaceae sp. CCFEE 6253]|nr:hypothetical protein LTR53_014263 [Teratosphaeriaceae sp. CCFEE 6253]